MAEQEHGDQFEIFSGNTSPFSQQYIAEFKIDGNTFYSAEHYVVYRKAVVFEDKELEQTTLNTKGPVSGGRVQNFDAKTWAKYSTKALLDAIEAKFTQNRDLKKKLMSTHPKLLVMCGKDRDLGIGVGEDNERAQDKDLWRGENRLGYALTKLRDKLIAGGGDASESEEEDKEEVMKDKGQDKASESEGKDEEEVRKTKEKAVKQKAEKVQAENRAAAESAISPGMAEAKAKEQFEFFFGNKSPFSQHYAVKFEIHGVTFNCAKQYMMYQQAVIFGDREMEEQIMSTSDPVEQTRCGRKVKHFDIGEWKKHSFDVVERASYAKFSQNQGLMMNLFDTFPKTLVDASPDKVWGIGLGKDNPLAWDKKNWLGHNYLGNILTKVRDRLMEEAKRDESPKRRQTLPEKSKGDNSSHQTDHASGHMGRKKHTKTSGDWRTGQEHGPTTKVQAKSESKGRDKYEFFFGNKSPFSQHHPAEFVIDGIKFNCAEQYMMYMKAATFNDQDMMKRIMETDNPVKQKRCGRSVRNFNADKWRQCSTEVVERASEAKFSQNPRLRQRLFDTYPKTLVECSPSDSVWGIGLKQDDPEAWDEATWRGQNLLGYALTRVRDRLLAREEEKHGEGNDITGAYGGHDYHSS